MILATRVAELLRNGEGLSVEFKRCSGLLEHDVPRRSARGESWRIVRAM